MWALLQGVRWDGMMFRGRQRAKGEINAVHGSAASCRCCEGRVDGLSTILFTEAI